MQTRRQQYERRLAQMKKARSSWEKTWREITDNVIPYRSVWQTTDQNQGRRKDSQILNSRPTQALETLAAGMMAGVTSPARDWFGLGTVDRAREDAPGVRTHLDACREIIKAALSSSNFYASLVNGVYLDLGGIGTTAMLMEEDTEPGKLVFEPLPVGEYWLDVDHRGRVDTLARERAMTVKQIVEQFGLDAVSDGVRNAFKNGELDRTFVVVHIIAPNTDHQPGKLGPRGKRWVSVWYERSDKRRDAFLRESGYDYFPVLAPRWATLPGNTYGHGPGWKVLGDCKMLQHHEKRKLQLIDKATDPPVRASGVSGEVSLLPGGITHFARGQEGSVEPIMQVDARALTALREQIQEVEWRIDQGFYADLWRRLVDDERKQRATATEIEGMRQEIMLMLGPVLENLNVGLLELVIENAFFILERARLLPEPPEALADGAAIKVQFISIMHQLQQSTGLISVRALLAELATLAQLRPEALDKLNPDAVVDELAKITGVPPEVVLSQEQVDKVREMRAEQAQAQQQGQAMLAATEGARNLANVDPTKLSELADLVSPAAAAQAGALSPVKSP